MYVLRIEIELDPRRAVDDVAAREQAKDIFTTIGMGKLGHPQEGVKVKLQKRSINQPPRSVRVS